MKITISAKQFNKYREMLKGYVFWKVVPTSTFSNIIIRQVVPNKAITTIFQLFKLTVIVEAVVRNSLIRGINYVRPTAI